MVVFGASSAAVPTAYSRTFVSTNEGTVVYIVAGQPIAAAERVDHSDRLVLQTLAALEVRLLARPSDEKGAYGRRDGSPLLRR